MSLESDFAQFSLNDTKEAIERIVKDLRRMATEIESSSLPRVETDSTSAISSALHTVTWGVANMNFDGLIQKESRIHQAHALELEQKITELEK